MYSSNGLAAASSGAAPTSAFDHLMIQSLMSRLQLGPTYLDTNSSLSQNLGDFLSHDSDNDDFDPNPAAVCGGDANNRRKLIAKEEARLEKELIRIINSGNGHQTLKPNSGQSVSVGDHNICVGFRDENGSEYRVWEWHGHIMLFDEDVGYSAEYIYGHYFERVMDKKQRKSRKDEESKNSGLRGLIGGGKDAVASARVVHRNSISATAGLTAADAEDKSFLRTPAS